MVIIAITKAAAHKNSNPISTSFLWERSYAPCKIITKNEIQEPSQKPSTPVLGLSSPTTSPAGTPVLHLTDEEEDIMDQDQPKDQWQDFYTPIFWTIIIIIFMFSV